MKIEMWPIGKPKPYEKNPRNNSKAIAPVAESIKTFGFRQPIVVDEKGVIIVGHTRLLAAQQLGLKEVSVHVAKMSKTDAKAYRIADNRLGEISKWEMGSLSDEIKELKGLNFDITKLGFKEIELKGMLERDEAEIERENSVPEKVKETVKPGDVWVLGDHRLVCGDSSNPETWDKLLGKKKADMVWTDPPYGVAYVGKTKDALKIENDGGAEEVEKTVLPALSLAMAQTKGGGCWYVAVPAGPLHIIFSQWMLDQDAWRQTLNWCKDSMVLGRSDYHYQHEPILYGWKSGEKHRAPESRNQTTIWNVPRPKASKDHPTMKPVELVERAIVNSSENGWIVCDPFSGSGTTIIAAEKTGRRGYGIELSPRYASVIVKRWEEYTGRKAKLETKK